MSLSSRTETDLCVIFEEKTRPPDDKVTQRTRKTLRVFQLFLDTSLLLLLYINLSLVSFHDSEFESCSTGPKFFERRGWNESREIIKKNLGKNDFSKKGSGKKWGIFEGKKSGRKGGDKIVMYSPVIHRQSPRKSNYQQGGGVRPRWRTRTRTA